jgi:hypothetical protein
VSGRTLSPRAWIRWWIGTAVLGAAILVFGIATRDVLLGFLGVAMLVMTPAMIAFWRRVERERESK